MLNTAVRFRGTIRKLEVAGLILLCTMIGMCIARLASHLCAVSEAMDRLREAGGTVSGADIDCSPYFGRVSIITRISVPDPDWKFPEAEALSPAENAKYLELAVALRAVKINTLNISGVGVSRDVIIYMIRTLDFKKLSASRTFFDSACAEEFAKKKKRAEIALER